MSTRRLPLASNSTLANSPLRGPSTLPHSKRFRSHAELQREETYGQPPPAKRQMVDLGVRAPVSPTKSRIAKPVVHRTTARAATVTTERATQTSDYKPSEKEVETMRQWQVQTRGRFPKMVFYFESIPDEYRSKLAKQVTQLGAREEKFFSINITHIITTRPIPSDKAVVQEVVETNAETNATHEQPKTIDPSLLNRTADIGASLLSSRRRLLFDTSSSKRPQVPAQDNVAKRAPSRNADVLHRAREMGKKIWSLDKLHKILELLSETDPYKSALRLNAGGSSAKAAEQSNFLQLLQNERIHGPSDRDPTVITQEIHYFKGPYVYVYDIEEKSKPIMIREYAKVADRKDGEWPQFRTASQGRCPFIMDEDKEQQARVKERVARAAAVEAKAPTLKPPEVPPPKALTGKRTLAEMEDGQNRVVSVAGKSIESLESSRPSSTSLDFRAQNAFMSHAKVGRFLAGEPVASGVQPSKLTSAIRSQMISSTTGALGARAGASKEIQGLQRKVLQKASTPAMSQDLSSRRMVEMSHDSNTFLRSQSLGRSTHRKLDMVDEDEEARQKEKLRRAASMPNETKKKKRDPKPGYCENCQDKFNDFDDHIVSRKHRKFAENDKNWTQLDDLLEQLKRQPKYTLCHDDYDSEGW